MTASMHIRAYYKPECSRCMEEVQEAVEAATRDANVAGVSLVAKKLCEHDALAAGRSAPASPTARGAPPKAPPHPTPTPTLDGIADQMLPGLEPPALNGFDVQLM
jgi:hypothetical protein